MQGMQQKYQGQIRSYFQQSQSQNIDFKIITGRNFEYPEALRLIQNEDYLDDADIDELRRIDVQKEISEFYTDVYHASDADHGYYPSYDTKHNIRKKRSIPAAGSKRLCNYQMGH